MIIIVVNYLFLIIIVVVSAVTILRGIQTDNYFNQNVPIFCRPYRDGRDNAIRDF